MKWLNLCKSRWIVMTCTPYENVRVTLVSSFKSNIRARANQEGVMNSPLGWLEVSGHRDVTT